MTDKQPKALRLADDLQSAVQTYPQMSEDEPGGYCRQEDALMDDAAAELRRLLAANIDCVAWYEAVKAHRDELLKALNDCLAKANSLTVQRDELLDALQSLISDNHPEYIPSKLWKKARAAIAKAEGEKQ